MAQHTLHTHDTRIHNWNARHLHTLDHSQTNKSPLPASSAVDFLSLSTLSYSKSAETLVPAIHHAIHRPAYSHYLYLRHLHFGEIHVYILMPVARSLTPRTRVHSCRVSSLYFSDQYLFHNSLPQRPFLSTFYLRCLSIIISSTLSLLCAWLMRSFHLWYLIQYVDFLPLSFFYPHVPVLFYDPLGICFIFYPSLGGHSHGL